MTSEIRVNKITHTAGVGTITTSADGIVVSGIITANNFSGNLTGDVTGSGANLTNLPAGQLTGALPAISGANLTGLSGVSVANQADNRLITATGTTDALNGESGLTFDGSTINFTAASGDARLTLIGTEGNDARISLVADDGDDHIDQWNLRAEADNHFAIDQFASGSFVERFTIGSDAANGDVTVKTGNLIIGTSGKGIDFSATPNGYSGTLQEILDDYEEGYWTPTVGGWSASGTGVYGDQKGRYTKIGNTVTVFFHIYWTALNNASGVFAIESLPFPHASNQYYFSTAVQMRYVDYSGDTVFAIGGHDYSSSLLFYAQNDNGNHNYVAVDSNGGRVEGCVTYLTDS